MSSYQYDDMKPDSTFTIQKGYGGGYGGSGSGHGGYGGYGGGGGGYGGGCSIGICELLAVGAAIAVALAAGAALFLAVTMGKRRKRSSDYWDFLSGHVGEGKNKFLRCLARDDARQ